MVKITIRCNRRERDNYIVPDSEGGTYEWKVSELKFSIDNSELTEKTKAYIIECYFCGDIFGILLSSKKIDNNIENNAFPVSKIEPNFTSPIFGTKHTHTIWWADQKTVIGKVARWDNTDVYGYNGEDIYNKILNSIENDAIRSKLKKGWKDNYFINDANLKMALWYIKMNPKSTVLDLYDFFKLNKITEDLTWVERLVKQLIHMDFLRSNKSQFLMTYLSSPDAIELELTQKGEEQAGGEIK